MSHAAQFLYLIGTEMPKQVSALLATKIGAVNDERIRVDLQ